MGNREPKSDDVVVYIDGSFDLLHIGHVATLKKAKSLGTYLIVGLHDDEVYFFNNKKFYLILFYYKFSYLY